jgi:hypothetical protein
MKMAMLGEATVMEIMERKYNCLCLLLVDCVCTHTRTHTHTVSSIFLTSNSLLVYFFLRRISYDITDVEDAAQVCTAIQSKQGSYSTVGVSSSTMIYDYSSSSNSNTYTWDGSSNGSSNSATATPTSGNSTDGFDWEGTKQQVGDTYNSVSDKVGETYGTVSEKVGSGITRASEKTGLAVEEVIGIVLGAIAGLCLFFMCGCYCCCKREEDPKQVHLIANSPRERKEWMAKDNWNTTRDRSTWA